MTDVMSDSDDTTGAADRQEAGHLLCLGLGYSASAVALEVMRRGWSVTGTTRAEDKAKGMEEAGITSILWDAPNKLKPAALTGATDILVSVKPGDNGCPALAGLKALTSAKPGALANIRSIIYFSSTGVYGDHDGRWVNEEGPLVPDTHRGRRRLQTEHRWEDFAEAHDIPMLSLRLAGIYGPGRNALETLLAQRGKTPSGMGQRIYKPGQVFSRIHAADIAGATAKLLSLAGTGDWPDEYAINLADDEPSPPQDVVEYAAKLLGIEPPPLVPIEEADLSPMARSFYTDNKRVSNRLMKEAIGYQLHYPTYREGLDALYRDLPVQDV